MMIHNFMGNCFVRTQAGKGKIEIKDNNNNKNGTVFDDPGKENIARERNNFALHNKVLYKMHVYDSIHILSLEK